MPGIAFGHLRPAGLRSERGLSLIEVLVSLSILLFVLFVVYKTLLDGTEVNLSTGKHMTAVKFAEMEIESITNADYDDTPPEQHILRKDIGVGGKIECLIKLRHLPLRGSIRIWQTDGLAVEDYTVDYSTARISFPAEMSGKKIIVSYAYEYPRRELVVIPDEPPYKVRLSSYPLRTVYKAVDQDGKLVPVSVDKENGQLTFQAGDVGKSVNVEYRGESDKGRAESEFISADLASEASTDTGLKLVRLTETWTHQDRERKSELSYVLAR